MATEDKDQSKDTATGFNLSTASTEFKAKTNDIFGCLSALEDKHIAHEKNRSPCDDAQLWKNDPLLDDCKIIDTRRGAQKRSMGSDIDGGEEDLQDFKKPKLGPRKHRTKPQNRRPDHEVHPERWKEYSLEDVVPDDMSEKSNTRTALAFLEDRKRLREGDTEPIQRANIDESACSKGAIMFTRKSKADSTSGAKSHSDEAQAKVQHSFEDSEESEAVAVTTGSVADSVTENETKTVSFKSRKKNKQSIRSRNLNDEDDDDNVE